MMCIRLSLVHLGCLEIRKLKKRMHKLGAKTILAMMPWLTDAKDWLNPACKVARVMSLHSVICKTAYT